MMERLGGGFSWSTSHNSPFKLTKLSLLDFPRTPSDTPTNHLLIERPNSDGTTTTQQVQMVSSYKYLGVHFDSHLRWNVHTTKVIASATRLSQVLWKVCKLKDGLSSNRMHQKWNTTVVVRFLYAADIWFTAPHTPPNAKKKRGSTRIVKALISLQRRAAKHITGGLSTSAGDILDIHANILPIEQLFQKFLFNAATRLCALPPTHFLHNTARRAARRHIKKQSPTTLPLPPDKTQPGQHRNDLTGQTPKNVPSSIQHSNQRQQRSRA